MEEGDLLDDRGPRRERRYALTRDGEWVECPPDEEIEKIQPFSLAPPWRPPREDTQALADATKDMVGALRELAAAIRVGGIANRPTASKASGSKKKPEKETSYLRLEKRGQHDSGEDYTLWELTRDAPEIRVSERFDVPGKPHAQEGDRLWQEQDDLTPFKLKRDGQVIAYPEWWQVRHWFTEVDDAPDPEQADPDLIDLRRIIPNGIWTREDLGPGGREFDALNCDVYRARDAVPDTPIRAGDFLIKVRYSKKRIDNADEIRVPWKRISRSDFPTIREHLDRIRPVDGSYGVQGILNGLKSYLGNTRSINASDETSPLLLVRLPKEKVSEPINASSDEAAIFELIASAGGRMPA